MATRGEDWSTEEIKTIIEDYFSMLDDELSGRPFDKKAHRDQLQLKLERRSPKSIDFKHCNISSVLSEAKLPFINGYKPLPHLQKELASAVKEHVEKSGFFNRPSVQITDRKL